MRCCSIRTLSLILASVQLTGCIVIVIGTIIGYMIAVVYKSSNIAKEDVQHYFTILAIVIISTLAIVAIPIGFLVTLIVGIVQHRIILVKVYVYFSYVVYVFMGIMFVYWFFTNIISGSSAGSIFLNIFEQLLSIGFSMLFFAPIFMHYLRMKSSVHQ